MRIEIRHTIDIVEDGFFSPEKLVQILLILCDYGFSGITSRTIAGIDKIENHEGALTVHTHKRMSEDEKGAITKAWHLIDHGQAVTFKNWNTDNG